jgi:hypothetical protein
MEVDDEVPMEVEVIDVDAEPTPSKQQAPPKKRKGAPPANDQVGDSDVGGYTTSAPQAHHGSRGVHWHGRVSPRRPRSSRPSETCWSASSPSRRPHPRPPRRRKSRSPTWSRWR